MPTSLARRCVVGTVLFALWITLYAAGGTATAAGSIELVLRATGAATGEIQTRREIDDSHFCALAGQAGKEQTLVIVFNQRQNASLLDATDFGFSLSIAGIVGRAWDETQPSTILQMSLGNRRFVGLRAVDPSFHLQVAVDPTGGKGSFSASHLLDPSAGATINIEGSWHCMPDQLVAGANSAVFSNDDPQLAAVRPAVPAAVRHASPEPGLSNEPQPKRFQSVVANTDDEKGSPERAPVEANSPRHFRLYHLKPCYGSSCNAWTATDVHSGQTSEASVQFSRLRIATSLIASARAGSIELWITGEATWDGSSRLLISARRLDGVVPRHLSPSRLQR